MYWEQRKKMQKDFFDLKFFLMSFEQILNELLLFSEISRSFIYCFRDEKNNLAKEKQSNS